MTITARQLALGATTTTVLALVASILLVLPARASGDRGRTAQADRRVAARTAILARIERDAAATPLARAGRCIAPTTVSGIGRACRTPDGLYAIPRGHDLLFTHGPDLVAATARSSSTPIGGGSLDAIRCSAPGSTRHVVLAYLLPADFASGAGDVHGDRFDEVAPALRSALLDAAALVDRAAGQLVPGAHRRLRVACDPDGRPLVERVVLPRTAAGYRNDRDGGFDGIEADLARLGVLDDDPDFERRRAGRLRRALAYYDADFLPGIAGQSVLYRRSTLLGQGVRSSDPLVSQTARNVSNNPPRSTLSVQYGTSSDGIPDPPLATSMLHELTHAMGAVQDEVPTATDAGHCTDGLDVMCYDDGGPRGTYDPTRCPDPDPPADPADERYDCNGDTYFHPAPPSGSPLARPAVWQLGLPANETFARGTAGPPEHLPAPVGLRADGRGTSIRVRWQPAAGAAGYDVAWRAAGSTWHSIDVTGAPAAQPPLAPRTRYELRVSPRDRSGFVVASATIRRTTGIDTTPPTPPGAARASDPTRRTLLLGFDAATDNDRVARYELELRIAPRRWRRIATFVPAASAEGSVVTSPRIGSLPIRSRFLVRLRAVDRAGNRSVPGAPSWIATR